LKADLTDRENRPLDCPLAVKFSSDGKKLDLLEYKNGEWKKYGDLEGWNINNSDQFDWGNSYKLSRYYKVYDWVNDDGYTNFADWIE